MNAHGIPGALEKQKWEEDFKAESLRSMQQKAAVKYDGEREETKKEQMSEAAIRKRWEREDRKRKAAAVLAAAASQQEHQEPEDRLPDVSALSAIAEEQQDSSSKTDIASSSTYIITVPTSSSRSLPWYKADKHSYSTIADACAAGIWDFPSTDTDRARCAVFRALWEKGNYLGSGVKFGGEYLVYPGTFSYRFPFNYLSLNNVQGTRFVITHISLQQCTRRLANLYDPWKL